MVFGSGKSGGVYEIKPQRITLQAGFFEQPGAQGDPFLLPDLALEDRFLNPNPIIRTSASHPAQSARASFVGCGDIVCDKNEHESVRDYFGMRGM